MSTSLPLRETVALDRVRPGTKGPESFEPILDVPITVHVQLERLTISFRELVKFDVDTVLPLTRAVGENIDLYVGGVLFGSGEILVVDGSLAIRVADLRDKLSDPDANSPSS